MMEAEYNENERIYNEKNTELTALTEAIKNMTDKTEIANAKKQKRMLKGDVDVA